MKITPGHILAGGAVALAGAVVYFGAKKAGELAAKVGESVNPADSDNIVNRAVTGIGEAITGDKGFSLGSFIYDLTHPPYDPNAGVMRYDGGAVRGPLQ